MYWLPSEGRSKRMQLKMKPRYFVDSNAGNQRTTLTIITPCANPLNTAAFPRMDCEGRQKTGHLGVRSLLSHFGK
jgi:hypothetical protein